MSFSFFSTNNEEIKEIISFSEWKNIGLLRQVLRQLLKIYPETNYLFMKFNNKKIGFKKNLKLNINDIVYKYVQKLYSLYNPTSLIIPEIIEVRKWIYNYKENGHLLQKEFNNRHRKEKNLILNILDFYLHITTLTLHDKIQHIYDHVNTLEGEIDNIEIANLIDSNGIRTYFPNMYSAIYYLYHNISLSIK